MLQNKISFHGFRKIQLQAKDNLMYSLCLQTLNNSLEQTLQLRLFSFFLLLLNSERLFDLSGSFSQCTHANFEHCKNIEFYVYLQNCCSNSYIYEESVELYFIDAPIFYSNRYVCVFIYKVVSGHKGKISLRLTTRLIPLFNEVFWFAQIPKAMLS